MPIYEYSCDKCGHQFDVLIRNEKDYPAKCPACGKGKPVKAFSTFAVSMAAGSSVSREACEACPTAGTGCGGGGCCGDM